MTISRLTFRYAPEGLTACEIACSYAEHCAIVARFAGKGWTLVRSEVV